jgi:hypothetical protein
MAIKEEWLDEILKGCKTPEDITGPNGVIKQLTKRLLEKSVISGDDGAPWVRKVFTRRA